MSLDFWRTTLPTRTSKNKSSDACPAARNQRHHCLLRRPCLWFLVWKGIVDYNWQPPSFSKWTKADERKLAEALATTVTIGHTALGRMVDMKKKELLLAAVTMSNDEFKVLRQERERQLNEQITDQESSTQTEDELVAALETSVNTTTEGTEGSL